MPALLKLFVLWIILCTRNSGFSVPPCSSLQQQPVANNKKYAFSTPNRSMPAIVPLAAVQMCITPQQNKCTMPISRFNSMRNAKVKHNSTAQTIPVLHPGTSLLPVIQTAFTQGVLRSNEPDQAAPQKPSTAIQPPMADGAENTKNLSIAAQPPITVEEKGNLPLDEIMTTRQSPQINAICEKEEAPALCGTVETLQESIVESDEEHSCVSVEESGLKQYKKWWFRRKVDISVNGDMVTGTPVFIKENTLRVIGNLNSYFIPLHKIDYIRTDDGLENMCESEEEII